MLNFSRESISCCSRNINYCLVQIIFVLKGINIMGIRFILMVNKQGQTRLAQYYEYSCYWMGEPNLVTIKLYYNDVMETNSKRKMYKG